MLLYTLVFCIFIHSVFFTKAVFCFALAMIKRHLLLNCMFVLFGGGAMNGVCLFGLTSNINIVSQNTTPLIAVLTPFKSAS